MTKLWLHAGFHKTGTTAIQEYCAAAHRELRSKGVLYPRFRRRWFRVDKSHHFLAHHAAGREDLISSDAVSTLLQQWRDTAEKRHLTVLLSAEPVCRHVRGSRKQGSSVAERQLDYLSHLSRLLKDFQVQPILVLRRQDDFVRSFYQEAVARGTNRTASMSFADFRRKIGTERARFLPVIKRFESVFGTVRLLVYEDLCRQGLMQSFFRALGIEVTPLSKRVVRASLSVQQTLIKRSLNVVVRDRVQNQQLVRWLQTPIVRERVAHWMPQALDLWASVEERQAFLDQFREENLALCDRLGSGRDQLFPDWEPDKVAEKQPVPSTADLEAMVRDLLVSCGNGLRADLREDARRHFGLS